MEIKGSEEEEVVVKEVYGGCGGADERGVLGDWVWVHVIHRVWEWASVWFDLGVGSVACVAIWFCTSKIEIEEEIKE